jgi:H+-transporting ATPase
LTSAEAARRLLEFGPNAIREERPHPLLTLSSRFWGPIPLMLEAVIVIQLVLGKADEAVIIALLLVANAGISFIEEGRANRALALLRSRLKVTARARRDGVWQSTPAEELVPGDLVHLRMGDLSPADVRLVAGEVMLDQSALTGESLPVEARPGLLAYAGAVIKRGEATGEVEATGARSYFGKTAELVRRAKSKSRLEILVFKIVRVLVIVDVSLVAILLAYCAWVGLPYREALPFALILLVASVPIALPVTFTLATALGAAELAKKGVLVTHLGAIEEAAGMDLLLTDKTGTITENRLSLASLVPLPGESEDALLRFAALASDAATQDPIDRAILAAADAKGVAAPLPHRLDFRPFDPALRYSEGIYETDTGKLRALKGAPSALAGLVAHPPDFGGAIADLAGKGDRVLAVAAGGGQELHLVGLLALEDPPRADSPALVRGLGELGVRVVMVTGDNLETACAVAREVGIGGRAAGPEALDRIETAETLDYDVFARAFPEHKFRLAEFYQRRGHIVGMTGDGVNDAPALKEANVGIAVAGATDVARAAAGIVLTRPGLVDALAAVELSRRIYQRMLTYTINKIVKTLQIAVFLTAGVILARAFITTPRLIVLLLFANDFVTMSLATDEVSFSREPDRWNVSHLMLSGSIFAALMLVVSFALLFVGRDLLRLSLPELQTLVFVMLVLTGQGTVYLARERGHFWRSRPSRPLILSSLADIAVVLVMAAAGILMTAVPISLLGALLAAVALYLLLVDQIKVAIFRRFRIR